MRAKCSDVHKVLTEHTVDNWLLVWFLFFFLPSHSEVPEESPEMWFSCLLPGAALLFPSDQQWAGYGSWPPPIGRRQEIWQKWQQQSQAIWPHQVSLGKASCYFRLNWAFCFWTCVSKRNSNCTRLPSVFTSQSLFIHGACEPGFKTDWGGLRRGLEEVRLFWFLNLIKKMVNFLSSCDIWGETRPRAKGSSCSDS